MEERASLIFFLIFGDEIYDVESLRETITSGFCFLDTGHLLMSPTGWLPVMLPVTLSRGRGMRGSVGYAVRCTVPKPWSYRRGARPLRQGARGGGGEALRRDGFGQEAEGTGRAGPTQQALQAQRHKEGQEAPPEEAPDEDDEDEKDEKDDEEEGHPCVDRSVEVGGDPLIDLGFRAQF